MSCPDREPFNVSYYEYTVLGTDFVSLTKSDLFKIRDRNQAQAADLKRFEANCQGCGDTRSTAAELARLKADYAVLLQANHRLGFGSVDVKAELGIAKRDLATVREHRDKLIESNRSYRSHLDATRHARDTAYEYIDELIEQRDAAHSKLTAFGTVLADAASALEGR